MAKLFKYVIVSARPIQWVKNISLFTGLVFTGWLFYPEKFFSVFLAAVIFSILTSSVYIFNDILDAPKDRLHPLKKKRPIAAGKLPIPHALFTAFLGFIVTLFLAINISFSFFFLCLAYLAIHIFYTTMLKNIPIIDVMMIASGFIIRVWAGAVVINTHINIWLLLCVISFSLFLAVGKRRSELTLLSGVEAGKHRQVLFSYPEKLLDLYISMFANTTWLTYALFTFLQPMAQPSGRILTIMSDLPLAFRSRKWLMITIPVVIFGVMRYLQLIYQKNEGQSPAKVLVSDKALLGSVLLWGLMVVGIIYGLG
jgi:4-hydroxybenzoate polyprenyltransferase